MKNIKLSQQNKVLLLSFLILITAYLLFSPKKIEAPRGEKIYADTLIPAGHVLIPIELANADSVSALMDHYGVVDLYSGSINMVGTKKLASKVKILRAPLNPNQYAVLVPENLSNHMMSLSGPFWAVVQNRDTKQDTYNDKKPAAVRIEYHQAGG